jgi:hypothetical protein
MSNKDLSHLEQLELKHQELDKKIKEGYTNYLDDSDLSKMKMEKAHIKRQLEEVKKKVA